MRQHTVLFPSHPEQRHISLNGEARLVLDFSPENALFERDGQSLLIRPDSGGEVKIADFFTRANGELPEFQFSDGVVVDSGDVLRAMHPEMDISTNAGTAALSGGLGDYDVAGAKRIGGVETLTADAATAEDADDPQGAANGEAFMQPYFFGWQDGASEDGPAAPGRDGGQNGGQNDGQNSGQNGGQSGDEEQAPLLGRLIIDAGGEAGPYRLPLFDAAGQPAGAEDGIAVTALNDENGWFAVSDAAGAAPELMLTSAGLAALAEGNLRGELEIRVNGEAYRVAVSNGAEGDFAPLPYEWHAMRGGRGASGLDFTMPGEAGGALHIDAASGAATRGLSGSVIRGGLGEDALHVAATVESGAAGASGAFAGGADNGVTVEGVESVAFAAAQAGRGAAYGAYAAGNGQVRVDGAAEVLFSADGVLGPAHGLYAKGAGSAVTLADAGTVHAAAAVGGEGAGSGTPASALSAWDKGGISIEGADAVRLEGANAGAGNAYAAYVNAGEIMLRDADRLELEAAADRGDAYGARAVAGGSVLIEDMGSVGIAVASDSGMAAGLRLEGASSSLTLANVADLEITAANKSATLTNAYGAVSEGGQITLTADESNASRVGITVDGLGGAHGLRALNQGAILLDGVDAVSINAHSAENIAAGLRVGPSSSIRMEDVAVLDIQAASEGYNAYGMVAQGGSVAIAAGQDDPFALSIGAQAGEGYAAYALYADAKGSTSITGSNEADRIALYGDVFAAKGASNRIDTGGGDDLIILDGKVSPGGLQLNAGEGHDTLVLKAESLSAFESNYGDWLEASFADMGVEAVHVDLGSLSDSEAAGLRELFSGDQYADLSLTFSYGAVLDIGGSLSGERSGTLDLGALLDDLERMEINGIQEIHFGGLHAESSLDLLGQERESLVITGDQQDSLRLGEAWNHVEHSGGYELYSNGDQTLEVATAIQILANVGG